MSVLMTMLWSRKAHWESIHVGKKLLTSVRPQDAGNVCTMLAGSYTTLGCYQVGEVNLSSWSV